MTTEAPPAWRIVFYKDARGHDPIEEYLNRLPAAERVAAVEAIRLLQEFGTLLGMPHAKHIRGKVWELRPEANRFFYFAYVGRRFIILHAYRKQSRKTPHRELAVAERRLAEVLQEGLDDERYR